MTLPPLTGAQAALLRQVLTGTLADPFAHARATYASLVARALIRLDASGDPQITDAGRAALAAFAEYEDTAWGAQ